MKIMLIDDDVSCTEGLSSALEPAGHTCRQFSDPVLAVEAYAKENFDVVITDMKMPGLNGIEVLKKIKALNKGARVIIVTGYGDVETAIAAVNNGAYAFFGKPVDICELIETLERIEDEIQGRLKLEVEYERLASEYCRLKRAYEEILNLVKGVIDKK